MRDPRGPPEVTKCVPPSGPRAYASRQTRSSPLSVDEPGLFRQRPAMVGGGGNSRSIDDVLEAPSQPRCAKRRRRGHKKRRPGHDLARRLRDRPGPQLHLPQDFTVPVTDSQAEQDLGTKISCRFQSGQGARDSAALRSALSTVRMQGLNCIEALLRGTDAPLAKIESQPHLTSAPARCLGWALIAVAD